MKIIADYHMHSKYSGDSKNEMEDIIKKAVAMGLKEIAITDHGPAHDGYGIKRSDYPKIKAEIDALKPKYPQINIRLGLEANILGTEGKIDVTEEMKSIIEWTNAGYHFGSDITHDIGIHFLNFMSKFSKNARRKAIKQNTKAMVNAMRNNDITMITHPGDKGPIDIEEVAMVAAETNTILEINQSHGHLSVAEIQVALKYDVKFAINSDAHTIENIGRVDKAVERAKIAGVPEDKIVNLGR